MHEHQAKGWTEELRWRTEGSAWRTLWESMEGGFQSPHPRREELGEEVPPQALAHQAPHAPLPHPRHPPPQGSPGQPWPRHSAPGAERVVRDVPSVVKIHHTDPSRTRAQSPHWSHSHCDLLIMKIVLNLQLFLSWEIKQRTDLVKCTFFSTKTCLRFLLPPPHLLQTGRSPLVKHGYQH